MRLFRRAVLAAVTLALIAMAAFIAAPLPADLLAYRPMASVQILDRDEGLLRELKSSADGRSTPLSAEAVSPKVRAAFLAAEDHGFFDHLGLSPSGMLRAAWRNVRAGRIVSGGSTITQQLARTLVPRRRTFIGKAQEALWAMRLEAHLSKEEILTQYVNRVPFGNNTFGLAAAAELYFGKTAEHLSLGQAAMLASIPRGPTAYNPFRAGPRLEARRQWVFSQLQAHELISEDQLAEAKNEPVDMAEFSAAFHAPHFVDYVAAHLDAWGLGEAVRVQTTLDAQLQADVEREILEEVTRLAARRVSSAASLVVDNATGEVLAYQGSADFFNAANLGQNDGVQMTRQPGSALKPFVYAEAFRHGYTPATVIPDIEMAFSGAKGSYAPKNYDHRAHGPVRAREALANSYNVPAVRVADDVGLASTLNVLHAAGFASLHETAEHYGLGLALGNGEVSLWEAARAYAGLSRGGVLKPLHPVLRAWRADGSQIELRPEIQSKRFADSRAVALVTHILSDNTARARAFGLDNALRLPFPVAAKTGTSKGYSDNWAVGYTAERTVAVWAGNFDGTPMVQVSGITGAGPVFKRVMNRAMKGVMPGDLVNMRGLERAPICPLSGERAGPFCPAAMQELFQIGTAPKVVCAMHGALSSELPPEVQKQCIALAHAEGRLVDLGLDFYDWAHNEGIAASPWLASVCLGSEHAEGTRIVHPMNGDEFLLISDLPLADQAIPLRIRAAPSTGRLDVRVDGATALRLEAPYNGRVPVTAGKHLLEVLDASGTRVAQVHYLVRGD